VSVDANPLLPLYEAKTRDYFGLARQDIAALVPDGANRVLEVGCGTGATLRWLKDQGRARWIAGVELLPYAAAEAAKHLDASWAGDIEALDVPIPDGTLDVVLCLDLLEHLRDPWGATRRLAQLLASGGVLIASIPNVQSVQVVRRLVQGRWDYEESGLLDRTHLRFFTRHSAVELITQAGLTVDLVVTPSLERPRREWALNLVTLGLLRDFFAVQFLIRGVRQ